MHGKPEFVAEHQTMVSFLPGKYIKTVFLRLRKQQVFQTVAHTLYRCSRALCCVEIWLSPAKSSLQKVPSLCTTHNALCAQLFCRANDVQHLAISALIQFLSIFLCGVYLISLPLSLRARSCSNLCLPLSLSHPSAQRTVAVPVHDGESADNIAAGGLLPL